jgi:hypothetical protein
MDLNGINYTTSTVTTKSNSTQTPSKASSTAQATDNTEDSTKNAGAIYEQSDASTTVKGLYTPNTALVNQMKADSQNRLSQLESLVHQLISKQGNASINSDNIWKLLQKGDITVDQETADEAKKEVSEEGYWGVNQTSDRIISFAKALTGGDPSKIDEMEKAFEKGFKEATKAWGADLPEISSKTYDAVKDKFDAWRKESQTASDKSEDTVVS